MILQLRYCYAHVAHFDCALSVCPCMCLCVPGGQDASGQAIGFLLGSLGVSVALTSEACYKGLPKTPTGDVVTFRGKCRAHLVSHTNSVID